MWMILFALFVFPIYHQRRKIFEVSQSVFFSSAIFFVNLLYVWVFVNEMHKIMILEKESI
jgi:hypothetical protein